MNQTKVLNYSIVCVMLGFALFVFRIDPQPINPGVQSNLEEPPSIIAGAQSVRPLALGQSQRIGDFFDRIGAWFKPSKKWALPSESDVLGTDFTGFARNPYVPSHIREKSYFKHGVKVLTFRETRDVKTGVLVTRTTERFRNGQLRRKIEDTFSPEARILSRRFVVFGLKNNFR